jgi:hypothetical protein
MVRNRSGTSRCARSSHRSAPSDIMSEPPMTASMKKAPSPQLRNRALRAAPLLSLCLLLLLPTGAMAASPASASGSTSVSWAYAGSSGMTQTGYFSNGNGSFEYDVHTFFGWTVSFTQYNTSSTTYYVEGQRALVGISFAEFCVPSCGSSAVDTLNQTSVAWQSDVAYANLTSSATVMMNGTTPVAALGLLNDAGNDQSNVTQSASFQGQTAGGGSVSGWSYWTSETTSSISVAFTPALGLAPLSSVPGDHWGGPSNFTESAAASQAIHACGQAGNGLEACGSAAPSWTVSLAGSVGLFGTDTGTIVLQGGIVAQQDAFVLTPAPFGMWDVIFLVPAPGIVIPMPGGPTPPPPPPSPQTQPGGSGPGISAATGGGSSGTPPAPNGPGAPGSAGAPGTPGVPSLPQVAPETIDMAAGLPHLGFAAAMAGYAPPPPMALPAPAVSPPNSPPPTEPGRTGLAVSVSDAKAATSSSSNPGSAEVQAQPTTTSQAGALASAWATLAHSTASFLAPPSGKGGPLAFVGNLWVLTVLGVVVVAIVVLMAVRATRPSREAPPPESPDFANYRAAAPAAGRGASAKSSGAPRQFSRTPPNAPIEESDPMDRLI